MITRYVEKRIQPLVLECVLCSSDVIHTPCNILGFYLVWPFRFVAVSVSGCFGLWPFGLVAVSVSCRSGLWPFRFVTIPVCGRLAVSVCGRFGSGLLGLWPLLPVTFRCMRIYCDCTALFYRQ